MATLHAALLALALGAGGGETVLLEFTSSSCGACRQMAPVARRLAGRGYPLREVSLDRDRALAVRFEVGVVPCFVLLVDGEEVSRIEGTASQSELEKMLVSAGVERASRKNTLARAQSPDEDGFRPFPAPEREELLDVSSKRARGQANSTGESRPPTATDQVLETLMAASVRIRIADPEGRSVGSGTIIDSREGEALILTCGHLFRESKGEGAIEIDLFCGEETRTLPADLVSYDLENDVALVSFRPEEEMAVARVAPPGYRPRPGQDVINIGCNHGAAPTARNSRISSVDKFQGPSRIQVAGEPDQGRSGGGLFTPDGRVIGVCNFANPTDDEGLYAALSCIHAELEKTELSEMCLEVVPSRELDDRLASGLPSMPSRMPPATARGLPAGVLDTSVETANAREDEDADASARTRSSSRSRKSRSDDADLSEEGGSLSRHEQAALDEILARAGDAEVICIVRPRDDPDAKSEIIVLDRASPEFLKKLANSKRSGAGSTAKGKGKAPRFASRERAAKG